MSPEQEKVRSLLVDTITLLCRNGLTFTSDVKLQGLLAITIDSKEFFVVQIDETMAENLADNQVDCDQPEQLALSQMPSMRKCEPQNARMSFRKRTQPVTDELNNCKSFCPPQSLQKDLLTGNFPERFSDNLSSLSAQIKVEDDDLLVLDSSGTSVVSQSYDYGNAGGDLRPSRKDLCDSLTAAGATPGSSKSSHVKQRHVRKRTGQWNTFEGIEWTGQGDISSLAVNYGLDETEDKHHPESQQDMTEFSYDEVYDLEMGDEHSSEASGVTMTFPCQYEDCDKAFTYKRSLVRHQRQVHGCIFGAEREVTYFCRVDGCSSTFRSEAALCRHRNRAHSQPN